MGCMGYEYYDREGEGERMGIHHVQDPTETRRERESPLLVARDWSSHFLSSCFFATHHIYPHTNSKHHINSIITSIMWSILSTALHRSGTVRLGQAITSWYAFIIYCLFIF